MNDSILYSAIRSLFTAFCAVIGIGLGIVFFTILIGALSSGSTESKLKTVNTHEIMPNAKGEREALSKTTPVILQINVDGVIGTEGLSMQTVRQQLIESREGDFKDDRVKALLVYINSPGGTVVDSDGIYRALKEYKEKYKVPVYAFVDGLCASGGMYVASAADKIYATDASLIGSVGVIAPTFMNVVKLMDKIGVDTLTLTAGTDKDAMNPFRVWKPGEEKNYQDIIDYYYKQFVNIVSTGRKDLSKEKLVKDYGAKIFNAEAAKENGYVDQSNATIAEALTDLKKAAGIEDDKYQVVKLENKSWWNSLFSEDSALFTGKVKYQLQILPEMDPALQNKYLYLYCPAMQ
ncbi:MAG: signal peptide peptidase SppA [Parachlamydiaceae bacterium]|nr:signal peptide peptidase SppA [Parachlamydiaceae bacterium]